MIVNNSFIAILLFVLTIFPNNLISIENIKVRDGEHLLPFTMNWDISNPKEFGQVSFESFSENKGFLVNQEENVMSLTKID